MPTPPLQIRVRDRRSGRTTDHRFTAREVRIGRDPDNDLQLADPHVSAHHAAISRDEHGAHLRDLGGTNGTRVAGRRVAPHATLPIADRLRATLGPFDLEILHHPDRDRRATSGALAEPGPADLARLHTRLRDLHALHAPHVAARRLFEAALADLVHALHAAGDTPTARRVLAEFSPRDHAHLLLPTDHPSPPRPRPAPDDLSLRPPREGDLSLRPSPLPPDDLSLQPSPLPPDLSLRPSPLPPDDLSLRPSHPAAAPLAAPLARELALIADAARTLLPGQRPPASADEARSFLDRLVVTLQTFAAGAGALQHLRMRQASDLGLGPTDGANPLLAMTSADELLAHLLAWRAPDSDRTHELLDGFTVLLAHARAHVTAALAATRHLTAELSPPTIDRHVTATGPFRSRARWHTFLARYDACIGDGTAASGSLRARFRRTYRDELERHGLPLAELEHPSPPDPDLEA